MLSAISLDSCPDSSVTRSTYERIDERVKQLRALSFLKGWWIPCTRGCDACCYDRAIVTYPEAMLLTERIRQSDVEKKVTKRLREWFHRAAKVELPPQLDLDVQSLKAYHRAHLACPLLHEHECLFYEDRPIACRAHLLLNQDPSACANRATTPTIYTVVVDDIVNEASRYLLAYNSPELSFGLLPTMLRYCMKETWL